MDAFLSWFFAPLLIGGSAFVILSRRPRPALGGLLLIETAAVLFFFFAHAAALALFQLLAGGIVIGLLFRLAARMPLFPAEPGAFLRPFGVLCGLGVAIFFGLLLAHAVQGIAGAGHRAAVFLFSAGLAGLVARRNLFIGLLSLQMLLAAAALLAGGGMLAFFTIAAGLVQGAVGAVLLGVFLRERGTLRVEELTALKF